MVVGIIAVDVSNPWCYPLHGLYWKGKVWGGDDKELKEGWTQRTNLSYFHLFAVFLFFICYGE